MSSGLSGKVVSYRTPLKGAIKPGRRSTRSTNAVAISNCRARAPLAVGLKPGGMTALSSPLERRKESRRVIS